eukprot:7804748-Lingulodinium_polyedra.AAC.1
MPMHTNNKTFDRSRSSRPVRCCIMLRYAPSAFSICPWIPSEQPQTKPARNALARYGVDDGVRGKT